MQFLGFRTRVSSGINWIGGNIANFVSPLTRHIIEFQLFNP